MYTKQKIIKEFKLSVGQSNQIEQFISEVIRYNKHTNIVGRSTLKDSWNRHVLDSLQISKYIKQKNSSILDMGTGAGIPGIILAAYNYSNISLIDSNIKKIMFVKNVCAKLNIKTKIYHQRVESFVNFKFDFIVSRALASLNKLFFYSQKLLNKNSVMVFLKGKNVNKEIEEATKFWTFQHSLEESMSDPSGKIIIIKKLNNIYG